MTTYAWPTGLDVENFSMVPGPFTRTFRSPFGGSGQSIDMLNDVWIVSLAIPWEFSTTTAAWEAFFNRLRGGVNLVSLWHMARPAPQGTMRGTPTLAAPAVQGASSVSIQSVVGWTVAPGDMFGCGGQLFQAADLATFPVGGIQTVNIVNRVRKGIASGTAVVWDKPTVPFQCATRAIFQHGRALVPGQQLDFVEFV